MPTRFDKHMIVVADLTARDGGAVEDVLLAAWRLQAQHDESNYEISRENA